MPLPMTQLAVRCQVATAVVDPGCARSEVIQPPVRSHKDLSESPYLLITRRARHRRTDDDNRRRPTVAPPDVPWELIAGADHVSTVSLAEQVHARASAARR
jgi:hypothetical protein